MKFKSEKTILSAHNEAYSQLTRATPKITRLPLGWHFLMVTYDEYLRVRNVTHTQLINCGRYNKPGYIATFIVSLAIDVAEKARPARRTNGPGEKSPSSRPLRSRNLTVCIIDTENGVCTDHLNRYANIQL